LLLNRSATSQEADQEQHKKNDKADLCDGSRSRGNTAKTKYRSQQRNYQEYPGVPKHIVSPSPTN
jgi:hypothetical protein